jgi:Ca2+-binding EF-hand superfamily protein
MHELQVEWAKAKGDDLKSINWKKTEIDFTGFKQLMDPSWSEKDLKSLFNLYDVDGNGKISWREYVCVCAPLLSQILVWFWFANIQVCSLVMAGSPQQKIKLLFLTFDSDGNGELSIDEFRYDIISYGSCSFTH